MKQQVVLVIGAGGYIGRHLTMKLAKKQKVSILVLDDPPKEFIKNPNIRVSKGSVFNALALRKALSGVDTVVNFAGSTTVEKRPQAHIRLNILAQSMILEECLKAGVKKVIFMSTINVYKAHPAPSLEHHRLMPQDIYSFTKMLGENVYSFYSETFPIASIVLRLGSVYGPGQRKGIVFSFAESARKSREIRIPQEPVYRDFVYIDDVVTAIMKAIAHDAKGVEVFNVSGSRKIGLKDMAGMIQKTVPFPVKIKAVNPPPKLRTTWVSNKKAARVLGFTPKTRLKDGLRKTLFSYRV